MKTIYKIMFLLAAASLMLAACDIYPTEETKPGTFENVVEGTVYDFEGTIAMDGFAWTSTSDIGIYALTEGALVKNKRCKIDGWGYEPPKGYSSSTAGGGEDVDQDEKPYQPSKYEGQPNAVFHAVGLDIPEGRNEFLVCAPYTASLIYVPSERMIYDLNVPHDQTQSKPNVKSTPLSLGLASGNSSDEHFAFTLTPVATTVKLSIASKEFEGYYLNKISLSSNDNPISGFMDYAIDSKETTVNRSFSYINMAISNPRALRSDEAQEFYFTALPGAHEKDLTVTFTLETPSITVSLPVSLPATDFAGGQTIEVKFDDLKSSQNNIGKWFCPMESRKLVGPGYAYGQANTFFIQCKSAVYNGATLSTNPDIPEEVVIDYRLRGDYTKAEKPEGVTFEWLKKNGSTTYIPRADGKFVADKYSFTVDEENYTVTVKNEGSTAGAPILVMKKGDKILWGWAFWNIAADGTVVEPVNIGGVELANLAIGQPTNKAEWISGNAAGHFVRTFYYYQFGRYLPVFWDSYTSVYWAYDAEGQTPITGTGNMYVINGPFKTMAESLKYPAGLVCHNGTDNALAWVLESVSDIWGCEVGSPNVAATKTQFDPCPKGWRVPDASTSDVLAAGFQGYNNTAGFRGMYSGSMDSEDYNFIFAGEWDGRKIATNGRLTGYGTGGNWSASWPQYYWTNYVASATTSNATAFAYWASSANKTPAAYTASHQKATATPIRCQKDNSNR